MHPINLLRFQLSVKTNAARSWASRTHATSDIALDDHHYHNGPILLYFHNHPTIAFCHHHQPCFRWSHHVLCSMCFIRRKHGLAPTIDRERVYRKQHPCNIAIVNGFELVVIPPQFCTVPKWSDIIVISSLTSSSLTYCEHSTFSINSYFPASKLSV